ncbi:MAG TPA: ATP-binding protein [Galbitalea sp.]
MKRVLEAYRLRRAALAGVALVAFFTTIMATTAADGHSDAGVVIDESGHVQSVSPTGFAWRDGIRPGQRVISSSPGDSADGWTLITEGPDGPITSREAPVVAALQATLPFALVGLGAGCLALAFLRLNRAWVLPSASLAFVAASAPLLLANQGQSWVVLAAATLVPVFGLAHRFRRYRVVATAAGLAATGLVVAWAIAYFDGDAADQLEQVRRSIALGATGLLMVDRAMRNRPARLTPPQALAVLAAALVVILGLGVLYFAAFPAPVIAIAIVLGLLAVQPLRSLLGRRLELALMADLRQHVAADVAEEERGRLARELHDAPLQELAAVIRRLELVPEAQRETSSLRAIAEQLRSVAVNLRPPMLDDIGLGAAIDFLAEQARTPGVPIVVEVEDLTGLERSSRPPAEVESALYRIVREATVNALAHAHAQTVTIRGRIGLDAIDLAVVDDGIGLRGEESRRASGRGRLGIASMRRRAQGIGAEFWIDGNGPGTSVSISWRA